jgi:hypothetical protein
MAAIGALELNNRAVALWLSLALSRARAYLVLEDDSHVYVCISVCVFATRSAIHTNTTHKQ